MGDNMDNKQGIDLEKMTPDQCLMHIRSAIERSCTKGTYNRDREGERNRIIRYAGPDGDHISFMEDLAKKAFGTIPESISYQ